MSGDDAKVRPLHAEKNPGFAGITGEFDLTEAQIRGYLSPESMDEVADRLGLAPAYVRGVATFYTMYNLQPLGKYLIQVCTNISCNLCGGDAVLAAFLQHLGTDAGETTEDGRFTVMEVECLGACGFPTAVQVNDRFYENVRPEDVPALLAQLT